jgi:prepilin-type N-terminal cleavage/methylation domain-containing protein
MSSSKRFKGFTIIEVVLVLAIAGLIFSMVFIALPALQRSQRDTQRKNDLSRASTAIVNYASNNRGVLPTLDDTFISQYLTNGGDDFLDPAGANTGTSTADRTAYAFAVRPTTGFETTKFSTDVTQNTIYYQTGVVCGSTAGTVTAAGSKKMALFMVLEGGGIACVNN